MSSKNRIKIRLSYYIPAASDEPIAYYELLSGNPRYIFQWISPGEVGVLTREQLMI